ncbi:MAG: hypothetical protein IJD59_09215, partial [Clostridia bacterium]|nr:hypothetical protein [Clostridia bacterium]
QTRLLKKFCLRTILHLQTDKFNPKFLNRALSLSLLLRKIQLPPRGSLAIFVQLFIFEFSTWLFRRSGASRRRLRRRLALFYDDKGSVASHTLGFLHNALHIFQRHVVENVMSGGENIAAVPLRRVDSAVQNEPVSVFPFDTDKLT